MKIDIACMKHVKTTVDGFCQSAPSATQSKDDWTWSMHGSLCMFCVL